MSVRLHSNAIEWLCELNKSHYIEYVDVTEGETTTIVMATNDESECFTCEIPR